MVYGVYKTSENEVARRQFQTLRKDLYSCPNEQELSPNNAEAKNFFYVAEPFADVLEFTVYSRISAAF